MTFLIIRHLTTYHYKQPVAFGEHRIMLRPRDDDDQTVLESRLEITPEPSELTWTQDIFGNHVAIARFADRASELSFKSTIHVDHARTDFHTTDIDDFARTYPFDYADRDKVFIARYTAPLSPHRGLALWTAQFRFEDGSADTCGLLVSMTQAIKQNFKHVARHEKGIQDPVNTLKLMSGSCRDLAGLMIAALRSLGFAARFVSGYLHLPDDDDDRITGGNTHAWVQVYVPGPGWIDVAPSSGMVGNQNLVRVAVVHEPREAIPLQGTWFGSASDHLAMNVAVKVVAISA